MPAWLKVSLRPVRRVNALGPTRPRVIAAMQGAKIAGAERLIAIDVAPAKLGWATALGATDVIDASTVDAVNAVRDHILTAGDL